MRLLILLFITTSLINSAYAASRTRLDLTTIFSGNLFRKKACCTTKNAAKSHKAATKKGNTKIADDYSRNLGRRR